MRHGLAAVRRPDRDIFELGLREQDFAGRKQLSFFEPDMLRQMGAECPRGGAVAGSGLAHLRSEKRVVSSDSIDQGSGSRSHERRQEQLFFDSEVRVELEIEALAESVGIVLRPSDGVAQRAREHQRAMVLRR